MIRCIVFDFDGTLVDSNRIKRETFIDLAQQFEGGPQAMAALLRAASGKDRYWIFEQFAQAVPGNPDANELAERYTRICEDRIAQAPEIVGTRDCLEALRDAGMLLFVNSATPQDPLIRLILLRHWEGLFDGVYGAPARKHENLEVIRRENGLSFRDILVVGDGESDRAAAVLTGSHFVAIKSDDNDFLRKPDRIIPDMTQLPTIASCLA